MAALHTVCAPAQGLTAPERPQKDEAPGVTAEGSRGQGTADGSDCASTTEARKLISTAIARAALLGIEVCELAGGAWLLRTARGADIGTVRDVRTLAAAISGFEAARDDVRGLVQRKAAGALPDAQEIAALKARAARAGFDLQRDGERFTVSRWGQCRELADAPAVSAFLDRVGAPR